MKSKSTILPLASALGALAGAQIAATETKSAVPVEPSATRIPLAKAEVGRAANMVVSTGKDLLGFVVDEHSDGTVVAQHASHASHASHHSHYSSR
jgi:hypothetical protein